MKYLVWLLFTLIGSQLGAQQVFYGGFFPEVGITKGIGKSVHAALKVESQHGLYDNRERTGSRAAYFHDRTDLQGFVGFKVSPLIKLDAGYHYRIQGADVNYHRIIQQLSVVQRLSRLNIGHRVRTDQNFIPKERIQYRIRYRQAIELPLQGTTLDPGEYYLIGSLEGIYSWQDGQSELENRAACSLGRSLSTSAKVEAGLDYRTDRFIAPGFRQRLWMKVGWFWRWQ